MPSSRVTAVSPLHAIESGRITIDGAGFAIDDGRLPEVRLGGVRARVVHASTTRVSVLVPPGIDGGRVPVHVEGAAGDDLHVDVAALLATGLHQVDNPVFDSEGNLYVTYSGTRGQHVPVSIFRVRPDGTRETFCSGLVNPTSMAIGPDGQLYVSSRFEGTVYRVAPDGSAEPFATDLGVACGLAFDRDGTLFVGDRSGTIFRVNSSGEATTHATLPSSIAAFHLALGPDGDLFVAAPTLAPYDSIFRVDRAGEVTVRYAGFGRPQGIAFDAHGVLHVVEALAGVSGLYRLPADGEPELVLAGPGLVGVAFDMTRPGGGGVAVCTSETVYRSARSGG
jgi:sugar lactone lactonase YvrE